MSVMDLPMTDAPTIASPGASTAGQLSPEKIQQLVTQALAAGNGLGPNASGSGITSAWENAVSGSLTPTELQAFEQQIIPADPSDAWLSGPVTASAEAGYQGDWKNQLTNALTDAVPGNGQQSPASASSFGTPQQIAQAQPLPFSSFGSIPQIAPTYTTPAMNPDANPMMDQGMMNQYEAMVQRSLDPTFQAQQQAQDESLASRGIFNSTAAQDAQTQLQGTQSATLAGAYAPIIQTGMTGQQSAASQNANAANSANAFNATAANEATAGNAATQLGITQGDQSNYNAFEAALLGQGATQGGNVFQNYLSSFQPQGAALNTLGQGATTATNAATTAGAGVDSSGLSSAITNVFSGLGSGGGKATGGNLNAYYGQLDSSGGE